MKLGFLGVGKIASAVVQGLCTSDIKNVIIHLSPRNEENSNFLAKTFPNVNRLESNQLVLDKSEIVFISVRQSESKEILSSLKFKEMHTVISFIPFLKFSELAESVKPAHRISRVIPLPTVVDHQCPIPIYNQNETVVNIMGYLGQPLLVDDENQLHTLWTLTGFIAPFYGLLKELSDWAISHGVQETIANRYIVDMLHSLLFSTRKADQIDFNELVRQAATPGGMNEQAEKEISERGAREAFKIAADNLLERFV